MRTFLTVATALWALGVQAADADRRVLVAQADAEKQAAESTAVSYKPPLRGAPATRVGGGTRSVGAQALTVNVLAPNETGFTTADKPTVYWYVSEPLNTPVELTLTTTEPLKDAVPTALELTLQPPIARGVHALRLGDHGVTLKPGVEYQWFVAVVSNPAQRSNDVVAGGGIKRIAPADAVRDGVWYDALDQLSQQISANPADARLRQQRAALLEQVGLREAAAYDRGTIR
ncbi:MAG TPA: DUF928 domain-containing protein [Burkholderiales bacterium]|nr:DUF928 domain-containing protein [Burkholderiales bacterium]